MLMSMTGFGRATLQSKTHKISVEIKSLNSKQLDLNVRLPYLLRESEGEVRSTVAKVIERGKADLSVQVEALPGSAATSVAQINIDALAAYKSRLSEAADTLGLDLPANLLQIMLSLPDSLHTPAPEADSDDARVLAEAVNIALEGLMSHRRAEGKELEVFFRTRIDAIAELLCSIEPYEAERVPKIRTKLEEALSKIPTVEFDRGRLEQELIYYIEKLDVNEEKQRLRRHLAYFIETMDSPAAGQGKKLGFIAQEMGREINTLGSKSNHAEMQAIVVKMKDLLEQIKEQILNVM